MSATIKDKNQELVKLRVIGKKYDERKTIGGKVALVPVVWNNQVKYKGEIYGPDQIFAAEKSVARDLIESGTVQLASEKPKIKRPAHIDHNISLGEGIALKEDVEGKIPTRKFGEDVQNAGWEDYEDEDYEDD